MEDQEFSRESLASVSTVHERNKAALFLPLRKQHTRVPTSAGLIGIPVRGYKVSRLLKLDKWRRRQDLTLSFFVPNSHDNNTRVGQPPAVCTPDVQSSRPCSEYPRSVESIYFSAASIRSTSIRRLLQIMGDALLLQTRPIFILSASAVVKNVAFNTHTLFVFTDKLETGNEHKINTDWYLTGTICRFFR